MKPQSILIIIAILSLLELANSREDDCPTCNGDPLPPGQACCNGTAPYDPSSQQCCDKLVKGISFKCCSSDQKQQYTQQEQDCESNAQVIYSDRMSIANSTYSNQVTTANQTYNDDVAACNLDSNSRTRNFCLSMAKTGLDSSVGLASQNLNGSLQAASLYYANDVKTCMNNKQSICDNW